MKRDANRPRRTRGTSGERPNPISQRAPLLLFWAVLALLLCASLLTEWRLWGLSFWGYWPTMTRLIVAGVSALVGTIAVRFLVTPRRTGGRKRSAARSAPLGIGVTLGIVALHAFVFYALRTATHFLGDGYLMLNQLAQGTPIVRIHNFGSVLVLFGIRDLLPLSGDDAAIFTYRLVAIAAGCVFIAVAAWTATRLFKERRQQWLWVLGMTAGGYSLLFFGYVEQYALFCLAVAVFTMVGMLAATGRLPTWWLLPAAAAAIALHGIGVALLPAAVYLLLLRFGGVSWWRTRPRSVKLTVWLAGLCATAGSLAWARHATNFARHALVPFWKDTFTIEGYTLLSGAHLLDMANLLLLLVPAIVLLAVTQPRWAEPDSDEVNVRGFLFVLSLSCLAAVFVIEAKLGMPRDWDLLAFAGIPLMAYLLWGPVLASSRSATARVAVALAITLGYTALLSRSAVLADPQAGVEQFKQYARLDVKKNRSGWYTLQQHYYRTGNREAWEATSAYRAEHFPEERMNRESTKALAAGRTDEAARLAREAIEINPMFSFPWLKLGEALLAMGQDDSAVTVLEIANALNRHSRFVLKYLGRGYFNTGRLDLAEECWLETHRLDPDEHETTVSLAQLYRERGDTSRYERYLRIAIAQPDAEASRALELAKFQLETNRELDAEITLRRALELGANMQDVVTALRDHPELLRRILSRAMTPEPVN